MERMIIGLSPQQLVLIVEALKTAGTAPALAANLQLYALGMQLRRVQQQLPIDEMAVDFTNNDPIDDGRLDDTHATTQRILAELAAQDRSH